VIPLIRLPSFLPAWAGAAAVALGVLTWSSYALAQFGGRPGGMAPPGGMGPRGGDEPREDGPAEESPDEEQEQADQAPLGGYPGQAKRATQIIEIDGYLRQRTDWLYKMHLGQGYASSSGSAVDLPPPFPLPLECATASWEIPDNRCSANSLGAGNLRLRLEPTINITDQVRVQTQVDVLDNTIAGSTPDSLVNARRAADRTGRAPISSLYTTQDPPEIGRNGIASSIRAKRAWGEVETEFGTLWFGRMPWHFGRGLTWNNGACPDCDGGTTVDRVMAVTRLYGHQVSLAWDFGAQGHHAGMIDLGQKDLSAPPLDLSQGDDVLQLMGSITKYDDPGRFQSRLDGGEMVVNYGLQLVLRSQSAEVYEQKASSGAMRADAADAVDGSLTREGLATSLTKNVDAVVFLPALWFKLGWKILTIEAEADAVLGKVGDATPLLDPNTADKRLTLRSLGWVVASELRLFSDAFFVGLETGGATGDQAENKQAYLNYRWRNVTQPAGDNTLADFRFSPDYHVDEILFRRILGTVTNAVYVKPQLTYWLNLSDPRQLGISASAIYSMAPTQVSTPGNALSYGIELNLSLQYRNPADGFYAGFTWAVLFPMGALERPGKMDRPLWRFDQDAETAHVLRTFLGVRF
jgi:uncharacterized protein (TIGR04551 family)